MSRTDVFEFLSVYGQIVGRSLCSHSLDTARISRGCRGNHGAMFSFSAFSSKELPGAYSHLDELLLHDVYEDIHGLAGLEVHFSQQIMEQGGEGDCALGDALDMLAPLLAQNTIRELILDEIVTPGWAGAIHRFMHSCLSGVTTLHCLETRRVHDFSTVLLPCTAALRTLTHPYERDTQSSLTGQWSNPRSQYDAGVSGSRTHTLPALHTIIVSMWVVQAMDRDKLWTMYNGSATDVRDWWDELIQALTYRRDTGLRVRTLRIIGGWTSQKLHDRTAEMDGAMLAHAVALVDELVDERKVGPHHQVLQDPCDQ
ncbi:hypothetical protein PENSPDRAFT_754712 [Peniophora sp. CONT]|nr:hypothetical protein PENSPDRAFT_754712 [Peniophora sp. CONT]